MALLFSAPFGAIADLSFLLILSLAVARELIVGRHAALGLRLGIATLAGLIALVGGRIIPSFTRNWLGRPLRAGAGTLSIYGLVSLAAVLRFAAGLAGAYAALITSLAGAAWTAAFGLFVLLYGPLLARPRARPE